MGLIGLAVEMGLVGLVTSFDTLLASQIGYVQDLRKNYENLHERAAVLNAIKDDVNLKMTENKQEMPTKECIAWLKDCIAWLVNVRKIENQIIEIEKEYEENEKYLRGWCPGWKLGKLITETIDRITKISQYGVLVFGNAPPKAPPKGVSVVVNAPPKEALILQQEKECKRDEKIRENGVRGSGGVSKRKKRCQKNK